MYLLMYFYSVCWMFKCVLCCCSLFFFCPISGLSIVAISVHSFWYHSLFWISIHSIFRSCMEIHTNMDNRIISVCYLWRGKQTNENCTKRKRKYDSLEIHSQQGNILMLWTFFWDLNCIIEGSFFYFYVSSSCVFHYVPAYSHFLSFICLYFLFFIFIQLSHFARIRYTPTSIQLKVRFEPICNCSFR